MTQNYTKYVQARTDKYFTKTKRIIDLYGDKAVTYGVFLRTDCIVAITPAIKFIQDAYPKVKIDREFEEGTLVASETKLFSITGSFTKLVELETLWLQKVGFACISAYNAYQMTRSLPTVPFMDMSARHTTGDDMAKITAYGASVGSNAAKLTGSTGFIGSSTDLTAPFYGTKEGMGTMPHAAIGYAGSTLRSVQMYVEANPNDQNVIALVDYFGQEITDSIGCASWFYHEAKLQDQGKRFGVRLDTHGGRYVEGLDYDKSVKIVCKWLHVKTEYEAVKKVMGDKAYNMDALNITKDKIRKLLFGTGVSAANIINLRQTLDAAGYEEAFIVASSGFNSFKCQIMAEVGAPIDMVGTGSFLPEKMSETYATADIYRYDDETSIKVGREWLSA